MLPTGDEPKTFQLLHSSDVRALSYMYKRLWSYNRPLNKVHVTNTLHTARLSTCIMKYCVTLPKTTCKLQLYVQKANFSYNFVALLWDRLHECSMPSKEHILECFGYQLCVAQSRIEFYFLTWKMLPAVFIFVKACYNRLILLRDKFAREPAHLITTISLLLTSTYTKAA